MSYYTTEMNPIFKLRPLTIIEIQNLFDSAKFQIDYTKSVEKIEDILIDFQSTSHFNYFISGEDVSDTEIGELIYKIIQTIHDKTLSDTVYDNTYEKVSDILINYFKTQNINTLSIKRIDDIIRSQMYNDRAGTSHFNFLKIKSQIDILLTKMSLDEEMKKSISELRTNPLSTKLQCISYKYDKDMEAIFSGILDVTDTYSIILKFYNLE